MDYFVDTIGSILYTVMQKREHGGNRMLIFDFDNTLAETTCETFEDYSDEEKIYEATPTDLTDLAREAGEVMVLTARHHCVTQAIEEWCYLQGFKAKVVPVASLFPRVKVPGVRSLRNPKTHEKKSWVIQGLIRKGHTVTFFDNEPANIEAVSHVKGCKAILVTK